MSNPSLSSVLALLRAHARIEEQFGNALGSIHGLALKELLLMMHLAGAPKTRLSRIDLAKRLHVSASTVTRMTAPLEKLGMVGRQADPRDARLAYVVLTPAGQRLVRTPVPPSNARPKAFSATAGASRRSPRWPSCSAG